MLSEELIYNLNYPASHTIGAPCPSRFLVHTEVCSGLAATDDRGRVVKEVPSTHPILLDTCSYSFVGLVTNQNCFVVVDNCEDSYELLNNLSLLHQERPSINVLVKYEKLTPEFILRLKKTFYYDDAMKKPRCPKFEGTSYSPEKMSENGMGYVRGSDGTTDRVCCYYSSRHALIGWMPKDEPESEHITHFKQELCIKVMEEKASSITLTYRPTVADGSQEIPAEEDVLGDMYALLTPCNTRRTSRGCSKAIILRPKNCILNTISLKQAQNIILTAVKADEQANLEHCKVFGDKLCRAVKLAQLDQFQVMLDSIDTCKKQLVDKIQEIITFEKLENKKVEELKHVLLVLEGLKKLQPEMKSVVNVICGNVGNHLYSTDGKVSDDFISNLLAIKEFVKKYKDQWFLSEELNTVITTDQVVSVIGKARGVDDLGKKCEEEREYRVIGNELLVSLNFLSDEIHKQLDSCNLADRINKSKN